MFLFKLNGCSVMPNDLSYLRPESFDSESFGLPAGFPHLFPHLNPHPFTRLCIYPHRLLLV